jgi:hypothetical protein
MATVLQTADFYLLTITSKFLWEEKDSNPRTPKRPKTTRTQYSTAFDPRQHWPLVDLPECGSNWTRTNMPKRGFYRPLGIPAPNTPNNTNMSKTV